MADNDNTRTPFQPRIDSGALLGRYVPFEAMVTQHDVLTRGGDLIRTWRLDGLRGADEMDAASLPVERQAAFRDLLQQLTGGRFALWTHRIRRLCATGPKTGEVVESNTAALLDEVYVTVLIRSVPRRSPRFLRIPKKANRSACGCPAELLSAMQDTSRVVSTALEDLRPHVLGDYFVGEQHCNEMLDFLALLVNGSWARQKLQQQQLYKSLPRTYVAFAGEKIVFRAGNQTHHAVAFGMTDYAQSQPQREHNLRLPQDCELIETQSFSPAFERVPEELEGVERVEGVSARQHAWGDYHYSLVLFANNARDAEHRAAAAAYVIGATTGVTVAPCDMSDAVWFSQWPGTWSWRARQARLSSRMPDAASLYQAEPDGS
jgi:type IV secretion system protein VirB4